MCCRRTALTHAEHASAHQTHPETRSDAAQAKLEGPSSSSAAATRQPPSQRHVSSSLSAGGDESRQRLPHYSASPPPPLLPPPSLEAALARRWLTIDRQVMVLTAAVSLPECLTRWAAAQAAALVAAVDCPHLPAAHAHNAAPAKLCRRRSTCARSHASPSRVQRSRCCGACWPRWSPPFSSHPWPLAGTWPHGRCAVHVCSWNGCGIIPPSALLHWYWVQVAHGAAAAASQQWL